MNCLKIDRAFIAEMDRGPKEAAVVEGIVLLGKALGKSITAEGIETADQLQRLQGLGCDTGQGFYLSRPLAAEAVEWMLDGLVADGGERPGRPRSEQASALH